MSGLKRFRGVVFIVFITGAAASLLAAPVTIRLSTAAPPLSTWDKQLADLGAAWNKGTEGRVTLRVFAGGSQGDEAAVVKKMRPDVDTLQGALMTSGGLGVIDKGFNVFTIPFFFENDAEELAVQKALEPALEQGLRAQGFHLVAWGTGGWIQVFSKKPLKTLADVKAANLYASKDDDERVQWYIKNGFHAKALTLGDMVSQLKNPLGMIDTAPNNPYAASFSGMYVDAKYMLDVHVAPLVGATVVASRVWDALSEADRAKMTEIARAMEAKIRVDINALDESSINSMKAKGLTVIKPEDKALADFRSAATDMAKSMRGASVPEKIFDAAVDARDHVRKK
jgi:TRAP-type C4-dicarboxylate transport system substrate-binding protein